MGEKKLDQRAVIKILTEEMIDEKLEKFLARVDAGKKIPRAYMTFQEFRETQADWSDTTIKRRIEEEGLPAVKDKAGYLIIRDELPLWFKRRKPKA